MNSNTIVTCLIVQAALAWLAWNFRVEILNSAWNEKVRRKQAKDKPKPKDPLDAVIDGERVPDKEIEKVRAALAVLQKSDPTVAEQAAGADPVLAAVMSAIKSKETP